MVDLIGIDEQWTGVRAKLNRNLLAARTGGLSIVSNHANGYATAGSTPTPGTYETARVRHINKTGKILTSVQFVYGNWTSASSTEVGNPNPIKIKAAVELFGTVTDQSQPRTKMTFGGNLNPTLDGGALLISDPIPCFILPGGEFFERIGVTTVNAGSNFFTGSATRGGTVSQGDDTGEGVASGLDLVYDGAGNVSPNPFNAYSAAIVIGHTIDGSIAPSVLLVGDSIAQASDDAGYASNWGGWLLRAFEGYPLGWVPIGGETENTVTNPRRWASRWNLSTYATTIVDAYGRNDLATGRTVAQLKADVLSMAFKYMARGQRYVKATILPEPSSTNGWYDVAGQAKSSFDAGRVSFNQWVRDPSENGFVAQAMAQVASIPLHGDAKFIDGCALMECNASGVLTTDGGYVLPATQTFASGTATGTTPVGSVTVANTITDSGKSFTVNAYRGRTLEITGGTGAGQSRCILWNDATRLRAAVSFSPAPDATSVYRVTDAVGFTTGPHPHTRGHILAAQAVDASSVVA